ncbi:putative Zinc finger, ZZ-type, immunoglobulin-like, Next to BRCA1, central domain-containing protein [Septoria linicola]|nr:putative Zinc finger, ZZ-type, immunoglobulin-like, Next to BRCA1, central domain-containing protein [Septoria linicola]
MASKHNSSAVSQDTLITIKISVNEQLKKLKLPLRDLGAAVLPDKLRQVLDIKPEQVVVLERFSDSAGDYITLDQSNPQVFKTLIRAAKAKGKLRLKATVAPVVAPQEKETVEAKAAPKQMEPIIVRSPVQLARPSQVPDYHQSPLYQAPLPRESVSFDQRSIGSGIFQFRDARNSQQTLINDEAPVPQPFVDQSAFSNRLAAPIVPQKLVFRPRETAEPPKHCSKDYSVYCNACGAATYDIHYHCSICHDGDYDLCEKCVDDGKVCPGESHWLIKRFSKDGEYVHSTTTRISSEKAPVVPVPCFAEKIEMPGASEDEAKSVKPEVHMPTRTCNSCVVVLPEHEFVTCNDCEDYDLCIPCHVADKHGHHPAHSFNASTEETILPLAAETKLAPGRNVRHNAICDGCDKTIYGIRHKCLSCPDWDYCNNCVKTARQSHPRHRFAALYTPIADQGATMVRHFGVHCDGPLCSKKANQPFISGVRYKCTICHDTDFCASCEALPGNHHNRTHPLIMLKTPVRNVSVSTENEDQGGHVRFMGDRRAAPVSIPVTAPSPVQTVAEIKPTEVKRETAPIFIPVKKYEAPPAPQAIQPKSDIPSTLLDARFVKDTIPDGMVVEPETRFTQVWTMKNPGPYAWPAGCSVRYVGGDNMLNVDNSHPASVAAINEATESNVVGREVAVGEEVAFKVVMKAPLREGKSISYWRVKAADGTPFGNRLWCDIEVKKAEQIEVPVAPMAPVMAPVMQTAPFMPVRACGPRSSLPLPPAQLFQPCVPSEQPPAYNSMDNMNLSARLAAMREQQKQRREQMVAQLNAQREQLQAHSMNAMKREEIPSWTHHSNAQVGKEALRQRVAQIKANIQKTREERERLQAEHTKMQVAAAKKKAQEESEKVKKIVEQVTKHANVQDELERSQMVFPKLDKESPSSSTYESATSSSLKGKAAYVENENGEIERSASPTGMTMPEVTSPTVVEDDFVELDDELEVLSANEDDSEDDGFLTDEEYDILDASDHETVASR